MKQDLIAVPEVIFREFLAKQGKLKKEQGEWFHSEYYVNEQDEKVAYMQTSSWSPEVVYKIKDERYEGLLDNEITTNLINNIINKK